MLEKLSQALKRATDKIANALFLDKDMLESIIKDLQRALLEADVNVKLVKQISDEIRKEALDERIKGIEKKEHVIKILHDKIMGILGKKAELELKKGQNQKIMFLGLYGAGKSSTTAKLAQYYGKRGFKTCMIGLDVHRPAAADQLEQLGQRNKIQAFVDKQEKNPIKIWKKFEQETSKYDLVFVDTAGRDALDEDLISEIKKLGKEINPDYIILVLQADIGQAAKKQAEEFQKALAINGVIITRMDSTAKGGGALTACYETKAPVFFITTGEHIQDIEPFTPESFISRMLGMGDLSALLEKVRSVVDEDKQKEMEKRMQEGKITLKDIYEQLKAMEGMGSLSKLKELIPGFSKAKIPDELLGNQEDKMKKWKYAIQSMTQEEIENPEILEKQTSRIARVAKGAGVHTSDVRALIKQYRIIKEFSKGNLSGMESGQFSQSQMQKLAKKFGKRMRM